MSAAFVVAARTPAAWMDRRRIIRGAVAAQFGAVGAQVSDNRVLTFGHSHVALPGQVEATAFHLDDAAERVPVVGALNLVIASHAASLSLSTTSRRPSNRMPVAPP
jgi:hypothetical protein